MDCSPECPDWKNEEVVAGVALATFDYETFGCTFCEHFETAEEEGRPLSAKKLVFSCALGHRITVSDVWRSLQGSRIIYVGGVVCGDVWRSLQDLDKEDE